MRVQVGQNMPIMLVSQFYMGLQTAQQWCTPTPSTFTTPKPQDVLSALTASGLLYPWPCVIQLYLLLLMFPNLEIQVWVQEVLVELLWFTAAENLSWSWDKVISECWVLLQVPFEYRQSPVQIANPLQSRLPNTPSISTLCTSQLEHGSKGICWSQPTQAPSEILFLCSGCSSQKGQISSAYQQKA